MAQPISITCARCGTAFRCFRRIQKFCSLRCYMSDRFGREINARPNAKVEVTCAQCADVFLDWGSQRREFCSNACRALASRNRRSQVCERCGTPFSKPASISRARWCSRTCYYTAKEEGREARFWAKIDRSDPYGCWSWIGTSLKNGYGVFGKPKVLAHRQAWEYTYQRTIPDGLVAMHLCDNRRCCNPIHLRIGTHAENVADKVAKGRHRMIDPPPSEAFQFDLFAGQLV